MFKIGAKIIYLRTHWVNGNETKTVTAATVTRINNRDQIIWIDWHHNPEDCLYAAFAYPDIPEAHEFFKTQQALIERHKRESDEFFSATIEFNNDLHRRGLK